MAAGRLNPAQALVDGTEVVKCARLAHPVADLPGQLPRLPEMLLCGPMPADDQMRDAEAEQCLHLAGAVVGLPGDVVGATVDGKGVGRVATGEVSEQCAGQTDGECRPAVDCRIRRGGREARPF